ncbi:V-type ATP synthase subunit E [Chlamydiales bacterium SCGC AB-751-O23]|jgi:V/A-type H+/Na+-transporting ATPase subunit E|nr:V-type ATP synthase subunit E [Chlamydiales bacterium SCGC AB-751-O23]
MKNMNTLEEKSQDKLQQICEVLRKQTLEPANEEADRVIKEAEEKAAKIIHQAEEKKKEILDGAQKELDKQKSIFENSLKQAGVQSLESLRQNIEQQFFNDDFSRLVEKQSSEENLIADIIRALLDNVKKQGWTSDISAGVGKEVNVEKLCQLLGSEVLTKLKGNTVNITGIKGGAQLKLHEKRLTLDLSDSALKELLGKFLRKDFRRFLFSENG